MAASYNVKEFLSTSPVFGDLDSDAVEALSLSMFVDYHHHHHIFCRQGAIADTLYLLLDGTVELRVVDEATDEEMEPKVLHTGDMFAQLSLSDDLPMESTAIGIGKTVTAGLTKENYDSIKHKHPAIAFAFLFIAASQMSRELQDLNARSRKI